MTNISINGKNYQVPNGITIIQACEVAEIEIPRFCYHERLSIAGNCRMCLVEVAGGPPKPVASCAMPISEGMQIFTDTPMVKKAREGVMEFLLANHPLDCPICDQAGECDLQDQAYQYGKGTGNYHEHKRAVQDKNMGPLIKTHMTRCIHCTRCVRFIEDVAGTCEIGAVNRGEGMEITTYLEKNISSELSGNIIDLCPVGALTSKPYAFKARSWELKKTESIDVMDAVGSNIRIDSRGIEIMRILPRLNEEINEEWISDKTRFCYDGLKYQRLDKAYIKTNEKLTATTFDHALETIAEKFKSLKAHEISALTGPVSAIDDIFSLKCLLDKIGTKNYDCRINNQKINSKDRSSFLFNTTISNIEQSDLCLIVATNPRKEAPILNARIRKRFLTKKLEIASIGCQENLTYPYNFLGNELKILQEIYEDKHQFCEKLRNAKNPIIIIGEDAISNDDGELINTYCKKIAEKFSLIRDDWNGFNFLSKTTGLLNGLELDFVGSSNVDDILEKCQSQEIKAIILHSVDDYIDFKKLKNTFVIYIGSHGDNGADIADIILPATAYSEKNALYANLEGRIQATKRAVFAPNEAKEDWQIFLELAKKINIDLDFKNHEGLRKRLTEYDNKFLYLDQTTKVKWTPSSDIKKQFVNNNISTKSFDFYLSNPIARSSKTLNKCSAEIKN